MNDKINKKKYIWWIFLPMIIVFAIQTVIEIVVMEFWFVYRMTTYNPLTDGTDLMSFIMSMYDDILSASSNTLILILYSILAGLLFTFLYFRMFRADRKFAIGVDLQSKVKELTKGYNWPFFWAGMVVFAIGAIYLSLYLMNGLAVIFPDWLTAYERLLEANDIGETMSLPMLLYALVLAPIVEELTYRGLVFKSASQFMTPRGAILISALMFGAMHLNWLQASYAFVLGLGLGYVMYLYDNLIITIVLHMVFNILGSVASGLLPAFGDTYFTFFIGMLASLVLCYAGLILLKKGAPEKKENLFG